MYDLNSSVQTFSYSSMHVTAVRKLVCCVFPATAPCVVARISLFIDDSNPSGIELPTQQVLQTIQVCCFTHNALCY